ncbi:MAG: hypothetical protein SNJ50_20715 [Cyanobacteriota bacterium]
MERIREIRAAIEQAIAKVEEFNEAIATLPDRRRTQWELRLSDRTHSLVWSLIRELGTP